MHIANIFFQCITCLFTLFRLPLKKIIHNIVKFLHLLHAIQCFLSFKTSFPTPRFKRYSHICCAKHIKVLILTFEILNPHVVMKKESGLICSNLGSIFFYFHLLATSLSLLAEYITSIIYQSPMLQDLLQNFLTYHIDQSVYS